MKWYWVVHNDRTGANPLVTDQDNLSEGERDALSSGRMLRAWRATAEFCVTQASYDGEPDDAVQNHLGVLLLGQRLVRSLREADVRGIQFLPATVVRPTGARLEGFEIAHLVESRQALDHEHSDYDIFPSDYFISARRGQVRSIRKAVLRSDALIGADAIKLTDFPPMEFVSQVFVDVFDGLSCKGLSFIEVRVDVS